MIRITKETDYATLLLGHMAERPLGEVHTAREFAEWSGLSIPMVSKILRRLTRGELVRSHRGVGGGYSLTRPAAEIALADVVRAVEGPISIVQCGTSPGACEREAACPSRINWPRVSRKIEHALETIAITDLIGSSPGHDLLQVEPAARTAGARRPA